MIGIWNTYSDAYLYAVGAAMLMAFGAPLVVVPLQWARAFHWAIPEPQNLTVFLGRSLGVLLSLLAVFAFKVTGTPAAKPFFFDLLLWLLVSMLVLHGYGAIKRTQPVTETIEIALWILLYLATLTFYPV